MTITDVGPIVTAFGLGGLLVLSLAIYFLQNPAVFFRILALIARLLYRLKLSNSRTRIGTELEAVLNNAGQVLQREMPGVFRSSVRLSWIRDGDQFSQIEEGRIVLFVKDNINTDEFLADSTMLYVRQSVVFDSRPFLERELVDSIDTALAQRFLIHNRQAYENLQEKYVKPWIKEDRRRGYYELACTLDDYGVLTRIVLSEYGHLALRLAGRSSTASGRAETVEFAQFVSRVVKRDRDAVQFRFSRSLFNSTVALIARPATRHREGLGLYKRKFLHDINTGVRVIHLLGRGKSNEEMVLRLASWALQSKFVTDVVKRNYVDSTRGGRRIPAICISCFSAKAVTALELTPVDEMYSALYDILPDTLTGLIEIVSVAREKDVQSKIVVRSPEGDNPIPRCVGQDGQNIERLKRRLSTDTERIDFIPWDFDPEILIKEALYPLRESEILRITVTDESASAKIALAPTVHMKYIDGKAGVNVRLAQDVIGYSIEFVDIDALLTPEEIAIEVFSRYVEPIRRDEVTIKNMVRHPEVIKVFVASDLFQDPAKQCKSSADFGELKSMLSGEYIDFVDWHESVEVRICNALSPLQQSDINSCRIRESSKQATVYVNSQLAARQAVGQNGKNAKAVSALTGYKVTIKVRT